jgi:IclR family acetate operon transcriptional repressor
VVRANIEIRDQSVPLLRELAKYSSEAVYLAILHGRHSVYLYAIEASGRPIDHSAIGERVPLHCTAVGKAKLAFLSEGEVDDIVQVVGLPRYTDHTITDVGTLKAELQQIRERGYSVDNEEHEVAVRCVAAPIFDDMNGIVAACSISGPSGRMTDERIAELVPEVKRISSAISHRLGCKHPFVI